LAAQDEEPRGGKADKPDDAQSEEELEVDSDVEDADGQDANTAKQLRKKTAASTYDEVCYVRRGEGRNIACQAAHSIFWSLILCLPRP
jgi:hypothetical protein